MAPSEKAYTVTLNDKPEYQRLVPGAPETHGMKAGRVHLEPGKSCGRHSTHGNEETLVFLAGRGCVHIGQSDRLDVGVGKIAYIPPETGHDVENTGPEPLVYVFCVAPAGDGTAKYGKTD